MKGAGIMKSNFIAVFVLLTILAGFVASVHADTRYVSDMLILTVRDRADKEATVLGNLRTADAVEVLEESGRYLKIQTKEGLEGWVQKNFITSAKPKALIINDLQNEITQLNSKIEQFDKNQAGYMDEIRADTQDQQTKNKVLQENVSQLNGELKQLTEKYNTLLKKSKKSIAALAGERDKLKELNTALNTENDKLKNDNPNPANTKRTQFFLTGAGVLLLGFFLGKSAKRKRSYSI